MDALLRRRLMMLGGGGPTPPPLPYDAQVEYLSSAGQGAYIDTGIECTGDLSVSLRAYWTSQDNSSICGGYASTGGSKYFRHHMVPRSSGSTHGVYWYQNSTSTSASIHLSSGPTVNTWHTFTLDASTGDWSFDATTGSVTPLDGSLTTGKNYGIFARIGPDGSIQQKGARFSYFKIWKAGVLVRDYIPVRVGSVGYLYDQVSQQLFGNNGTGSFAYGNDVTP